MPIRKPLLRVPPKDYREWHVDDKDVGFYFDDRSDDPFYLEDEAVNVTARILHDNCKMDEASEMIHPTQAEVVCRCECGQHWYVANGINKAILRSKYDTVYAEMTQARTAWEKQRQERAETILGPNIADSLSWRNLTETPAEYDSDGMIIVPVLDRWIKGQGGSSMWVSHRDHDKASEIERYSPRWDTVPTVEELVATSYMPWDDMTVDGWYAAGCMTSEDVIAAMELHCYWGHNVGQPLDWVLMVSWKSGWKHIAGNTKEREYVRMTYNQWGKAC